MSDMGDDFRALKEHSKSKRAANRQGGARALLVAGIPFESKNGGAHLIVGTGRDFDFWPGTGKWVGRRGQGNGRGVRNLITRIGALKEELK